MYGDLLRRRAYEKAQPHNLDPAVPFAPSHRFNGGDGGRLYIAFVDGKAAGCIAFHSMQNGRDCEFKRLFTRLEFRGQHVGKALFARALAEAEAMGYEHVYLDTLQRLEAANIMYQAFGFHKISAYYNNPLPGVVYYRYDLPAAAAEKKTAALRAAV